MMIQVNQTQIEQWERFEITFSGPSTGNPFKDVQLKGQFSYQHRTIDVDGFYDGNGYYKIRFMPDTQGNWNYKTVSNHSELDGQKGEFSCTPPIGNNHGPVQVRETHHFEYADRTPYFPFGTTCYVWNHQGDALEEQTLKTLESAPFNKIRMCVFPKWYPFNKKEPEYYPFEGKAPNQWDFTKFNPEYFQHLEKRIEGLLALGIEADLILFHPYDEGHWGFDHMSAEEDAYYLKYVIARLSSFRNIWWSMANEYDLFETKTMTDFDDIFKTVQACDPYQHLRSNHNSGEFYDHNKPWVSHASIQFKDLRPTGKWRSEYKKPIVVDECCYEGNIHRNWGNITAQEMVLRFWIGFVLGGYVGHGETYVHKDDILWWAKGGVLHGTSPERIGFLRKIIEEAPVAISPIKMNKDMFAGGKEGEYLLIYFGIFQPAFRPLDLPNGPYTIDVIDTWEMTIIRLDGVFDGECRVELPGKQYMALRIQKA